MSTRKLRVLCLHGYQQDAASFRSKCGGFRSKLKSLAEFLVIDAPLIIGGNPEKRGWVYIDEETTPSDCPEDPTGLQRSLDAVGDAVEKHGPFDGILAFSQGAFLAALLFQLIEKPQPAYKVNPNLHFRFVVCVCGVKSRKHDIVTPNSVPSLHLIGKTDQIVLPEKAHVFSQFFKCREIFEFDSGHHVPSSGEPVRVTKEFLKKFMKPE